MSNRMTTHQVLTAVAAFELMGTLVAWAADVLPWGLALLLLAVVGLAVYVGCSEDEWRFEEECAEQPR